MRSYLDIADLREGRQEPLSQPSTRHAKPVRTLTLGALGPSRAHFTRVFTRSEGVSPADYVLDERMRRAASLLVSSAAAVKQVSRDCGFDDANYFFASGCGRERAGSSPF
ncbi:MAG TPA: helix-turn-helix domain-containing protein [Roseiarcus sp.]|nr:helix-turn-helix domain-containing protein [Roseiarcus sp.]